MIQSPHSRAGHQATRYQVPGVLRAAHASFRYSEDMVTGIIRSTQTSMGVSMKDLADRLGVGVQAVSTLELNDDRGTLKVESRQRALLALGKREIPVVTDAVSDIDAEAIEASARKLVERLTLVAAASCPKCS